MERLMSKQKKICEMFYFWKRTFSDEIFKNLTMQVEIFKKRTFWKFLKSRNEKKYLTIQFEMNLLNRKKLNSYQLY